MKKLLLTGIFYLLNFILVQAQEIHNLKSYWDKGLYFQNEDGNFKIKFGGRIQYQWSFLSQDTDIENLLGKTTNGTEFRRVRFYTSGLIYNFINYKLEVDFAGSTTTLKDAYISIGKIPVLGKFTAGHFREPFGLDNLNSSNDMTFIERAPIIDIAPGRNNGFMISNTAINNKATWAVGVFRETDNQGKSITDNKYNLTGRVTLLPFFNNNLTKLVHIGSAYSYRSPDENEYQLSSKPEAHLLPSYINTGTIEQVANVQLTGIEIALVNNSFSLQAEYTSSSVNRDEFLDSYSFFGYYTEVSYFLTGEHKNYSKKTGTFKRVAPKSNFNPQGKGSGAIELVARYAYTDYSDKLIEGGVLDDITVGINWHLNTVTKFSIDYTSVKLESVGNDNIVQMKFQVAF